MGTLVRKIPNQISGLGVANQSQYIPQDYVYSYALAGIPFLSGIRDDRPYTERMAPIRKEQFDNFAEPGEQSLQGWWLRSQSTFTGGAGILYQDPDNTNQFNYRFADSLGVNPWISGHLELLRRTTLKVSSANTPNLVQGFVDGSGVDAYWDAAGGDFKKVTDAATTSITAAGPTILDMSSSGKIYVLARTDGVYTGTDAGAPAQQYNTALTNATIEVVKDRVVLGFNASVYQLVLAPAGAPVALPAASYTHLDPNWRWRSFTDGPTAVYAAGDSGTTSQIHKFSVIDNAGVPQFKWAGVTATMPAGETIRTIYSYVESFIGIATNKGFRVGTISSNGDISYGPLLFEPAGGCQAIVGNDRFMWVGSTNAHDGQSGLFRVDLGNATQDQTSQTVKYAYARDIYATGDPDAVTSVTMFGSSSRKVFALSASGSFLEHATELVPSGYLKTGRIRFNTEEPKLYKFFSVRTPSPLDGNVEITLLTEGGGEIPTVTFGPAASPGQKDVGISNPTGPQNWLALKFTLSRGSNLALGGVLNGWQVKALPGSIRQRMINQVFQLLDFETDMLGQEVGYPGYARDRFEQFKSVARAGDVVLYQELRDQTVTQVLIEDWEYRQSGPPGTISSMGGYLTVSLRTTAESS